MKFVIAMLLSCCFSAASYASDWYEIKFDAKGPGRLETLGGVTYLMAATVAVPLPKFDARIVTGTGTCSVYSVKFNPPSQDARKEWVALLLTAIATGKAIQVYGDCYPEGNVNTSGPTLEASRLVLTFRA